LNDERPGGAGADPRDRLVLDEARSLVEQQRRDLEGLRGRASTQAGVAVAVAGFLGGIGLRDGAEPSCLTWLALECLVLAVLACLYVLKPRTFHLGLDVKYMDDLIDEGQSFSEMSRNTAHGLIENFGKNQSKLIRLHWTYFVSLVAVVGEMSFFLLDLARS
jgi:hypothetical protein